MHGPTCQHLLLVLLATCMALPALPIHAASSSQIFRAQAKTLSAHRHLHTPNAHPHQLSQPLLPPCDTLLSVLGRHTFDALGHEVQVLQQHLRTQLDLEATLNAHRGGPPADPKEAYAWRHTWATNMTTAQMEEALANINKVSQMGVDRQVLLILKAFKRVQLRVSLGICNLLASRSLFESLVPCPSSFCSWCPSKKPRCEVYAPCCSDASS